MQLYFLPIVTYKSNTVTWCKAFECEIVHSVVEICLYHYKNLNTEFRKPETFYPV